MTQILVTGGIGFVGINLVRYLAQTVDDAQIFAADLLKPDAEVESFLSPVARQVHCIPLDVTDQGAVKQLLRQERISHIVHGAAITPTPQRERDRPGQIVDVNLIGAINILNASLESPNVERVVSLSSSGLYGAPTTEATHSQPEEGPLQLDNLYSITKYSAELLATRYAELCGKIIVSARLAAPYGPMERPTGSRERMGQLQQLEKALRQGQRVRVAGATVRRDWTYVDDTAEAIRALLFAPRLRHSVYNIGCGQSYTFRQVVDVFVAHGLTADWINDPANADVTMLPHQERAPLDISRLQTDTAFVPHYNLVDGVAAYITSDRLF